MTVAELIGLLRGFDPRARICYGDLEAAHWDSPNDAVTTALELDAQDISIASCRCLATDYLGITQIVVGHPERVEWPAPGEVFRGWASQHYVEEQSLPAVCLAVGLLGTATKPVLSEADEADERTRLWALRARALQEHLVGLGYSTDQIRDLQEAYASQTYEEWTR